MSQNWDIKSGPGVSLHENKFLGGLNKALGFHVSLILNTSSENKKGGTFPNLFVQSIT